VLNLHAFIIRELNLPLVGSSCRALGATLLVATTRNGLSRADTVPKGIAKVKSFVSLILILFRDTSAPLPESACRGCDTLDQLFIEVSAQPATIAAIGVVREVH
jgi:hypothetical protein